MGSWGTGPFDNDDAANMTASMIDHVKKVVNGSVEPATRGRRRGLLVRYHYQAARFGVQVILMARGTDILGGPSLHDCLKALLRIRQDEEWLHDWQDPEQIKSAIDREIVQVNLALGEQFVRRLEQEEREREWKCAHSKLPDRRRIRTRRKKKARAK